MLEQGIQIIRQLIQIEQETHTSLHIYYSWSPRCSVPTSSPVTGTAAPRARPWWPLAARGPTSARPRLSSVPQAPRRHVWPLRRRWRGVLVRVLLALLGVQRGPVLVALRVALVVALLLLLSARLGLLLLPLCRSADLRDTAPCVTCVTCVRDAVFRRRSFHARSTWTSRLHSPLAPSFECLAVAAFRRGPHQDTP